MSLTAVALKLPMSKPAPEMSLLFCRASENSPFAPSPPHAWVVNERTGTVVMGGNVTISSCSILHGALSIQVTTEFQVSQPAPFSKTGQTIVTPQTTVQAQESPAQVVQLKEGATVENSFAVCKLSAPPRATSSPSCRA